MMVYVLEMAPSELSVDSSWLCSLLQLSKKLLGFPTKLRNPVRKNSERVMKKIVKELYLLFMDFLSKIRNPARNKILEDLCWLFRDL
jgi:hypothetical protein